MEAMPIFIKTVLASTQKQSGSQKGSTQRPGVVERTKKKSSRNGQCCSQPGFQLGGWGRSSFMQGSASWLPSLGQLDRTGMGSNPACYFLVANQMLQGKETAPGTWK